ncbi:unnamed protein product [Prunus brigantina]
MADVAQQHGVAGISFQLAKGMTFLTLRPWMQQRLRPVRAKPWRKGPYLRLRRLGRLPRPLGRKRGREAVDAEPAVIEAAPAREVVAEMVLVQRPKKRALLILSEGEDEGDVPAVIAKTAVEVPDAEEVRDAEEAVQEEADAVDTAEGQAEEEDEEEEAEEDVEMPEVDEGPTVEETVVELSDGEIIAERPAQTVLAEVLSASIAVPTPTAPASAASVPFIPRRPGGIRIGSPPRPSVPLSSVVASVPPASLSQEPVVVTAPVVAEGPNGGAPSPLLVSSGEAASLDDLESLFASLHEEGDSSALAPLDEDYKAVLERLREFLFCDAHQMTTAEAFAEFRACLDEAMAMGLLDSAQLDELQVRLAEGEEMLGRCAEASMRMTEGCLLEQELAAIKKQVQPTMARLKENDLVVRRENEELAQVEAQIAELQARRSLILQRRNGAAAAGAELKSSARKILKAAAEKKKALAEGKLIRAKWQADINSGDIAWRRITCLVWGMFSEGMKVYLWPSLLMYGMSKIPWGSDHAKSCAPPVGMVQPYLMPPAFSGPRGRRTRVASSWSDDPERLALGQRRKFGRDADMLLLNRPNQIGDRFPSTLVMIPRSRCPSLDGLGWLWCALGRFAEPRGILGGPGPTLRPRHGMGRASFSWGRWAEGLLASA